MSMKTRFDVTQFGAVPNDGTDATAAFQAALNAAASVRGEVSVPPGTYRCAMLKIPAGVCLSGTPAWSFRNAGASIVELLDANSPCLLNITGAFGCTIRGLSLSGGNLGESIHGICLTHADYNGGGQEDTPTVEDCRVDSFSGDGVHLNHIWCFSLRHSMLCFNKGHGLYINGWDGFILDNWFSGNHGAGIYADKVAASVTMTGNRVEWNRSAGFSFYNSNTLNINGNYFDRSGGPALVLRAEQGHRTDTVTVTGNIFNRSGGGDFAETPPVDSADNTHVRLERCRNVVVSTNSFRVGRNDGGTGLLSPQTCVVYGELEGCVIKDNAMYGGCIASGLRDLGGHADAVIVKDNATDMP